LSDEKPNSYPDWCMKDNLNGENNTPTKSVYPQSKIDDGWDIGEPPPREWMNFYQNLTAKWIRYFDSQIDSMNKNLDEINKTISDFSGRIKYCETEINKIEEKTQKLMEKFL
jgi:hypothetical protein